MLTALANRNSDIQRLLDKGYALEVDSAHLVVHDVPYLDGMNLKLGAIVTKLEFIDATAVKQANHQVYFAGSAPCGLNGAPIPNLGDNPANVHLSSPQVQVQRIWSNKPTEGFPDFFAKIEHYVNLISGPAIALYPGASPLTFKRRDLVASASPFIFQDTLTSRAEIGDLSAKLKEDEIAIIGLGGTGAYVLDSIVRCPVKRIVGFDEDRFHVHNTYRSPGRLEEAELGKSKAEVYQKRYEAFRNGIQLEHRFIDSTSAEQLAGVTFAFVCVDKGSARKEIFDLLITLRIPFIDVGMGLNRNRGPLAGTIRISYYPPEDAERLKNLRHAELADLADDVYRQNVQIGELNSFNAALAVVKYKKIRGFYAEEGPWFNLLCELSDVKLFKDLCDEDQPA